MSRAMVVATLHGMDDRHYLCEQCGLKWFVPASRPDTPQELHCGECGAVLTPRDELFVSDQFLAPDQSVGA